MTRRTIALVGSAALTLAGTMLCGAAPAHAQGSTVTAIVQGGHITDVQVDMPSVLQAAGFNVTQGFALKVGERIALNDSTLEEGIGRGPFDQNNPIVHVQPLVQFGSVANGAVGKVDLRAVVAAADGSIDEASYSATMNCQLDASANGTCTSSS
ncbi:hypothetical protein ACFOSC_23140 [Streptantibioticus rubrisoli]|uniref:Uncharacterized protein n=1 Tax=Streptantibioticus rubrisoli TaxID=1387313 RepID=A0ABT1PFZ8_9ACTN|nr:hypothetical protein [Streptantibioticus rubrisoli]MCQ4043153.1 hypothetical protein [Streptantibioticus rubrisoli]